VSNPAHEETALQFNNRTKADACQGFLRKYFLKVPWLPKFCAQKIDGIFDVLDGK